MITITLPDGNKKTFENPISSNDVAKSISPNLAKHALLAEVNGDLWDINRNIENNSTVNIITSKDTVALSVLRHDAAHVLAEAVLELFPDTKITIGPAVENGFYYDFSRSKSFIPEDLEKIENRMHDIVNRNEEIVREVWNREKAEKFFKENGENFKLELLKDIPKDQEITFYRQGKFIDLCRGPHFNSTKLLGHSFKLMKLAGSYWRGDSKNPPLQRIYGTAFFKESELKEYINMIEEAEKRDHRKLGRKLDLFHLQEAATGSVFWHSKGYSIFLEIENYIRRKLKKNKYNEVKTPQLIDSVLWEKSGHWDKFQENMFIAEGDNQKVLALKPMNCPGHVQIYKQGLKSYKDLPIRMSEFGCCHRNEPSGSIHGIMRVRQFTQDDAHIFCTEEQVLEESLSFCDLLIDVYKDFGFSNVKVKFSDRPKVRAGSDETWSKSEKALLNAVKKANLDYELNPGEGAFYGPKLEFVLTDSIGRDWQCGTLQMDFVLPQRLDATYIDTNGNRKYPVMLHRAILGSLERWIGIIIEQYSGKLPLWLAPTQVIICNITEKFDNYCKKIYKILSDENIRVELDLRNEKIGYKIREHSLSYIPVILIIGEKEKENHSLAIRYLGSKKQEVKKMDDFLYEIKLKCKPPDLV